MKRYLLPRCMRRLAGESEYEMVESVDCLSPAMFVHERHVCEVEGVTCDLWNL